MQAGATVPALKRLLHVAVLVTIGIAVLSMAALLLWRAWLLLLGEHTSDAYNFWAAARAMLHGYSPYLDVFEAKPPAIFVLGAASLRLTGNFALGNALNAAMVLLAPVLFICALQPLLKGKEAAARFLLLTFAFLSGGILILYASVNGNGWQTEWYGGFAGMLYAAALARDRLQPSRWNVLMATSGCIGAIGFKEPFALAIVASALILPPSARSALRLLFLPLAVTALIGLLALELLGLREAYLNVYLPAMFGHQILRGDPLWLRAFAIHRLVPNLAQFSPLLATLLAASTLLAACETTAISLHRWWKHPTVLRALAIAAAIALVIFAVGVGGDYQMHHFLFALPVYAALLLKSAELASAWGQSARSHSPLVALTFLAAATALTTPVTLYHRDALGQRLRIQQQEESVLKEVAQSVDALLDACDVDRYTYMKTPPFYAFTRHTPQNYLLYSTIEHLPRHHESLILRGIQNLVRSQLIILGTPRYEPESALEAEQRFGEGVQAFLDARFTTEPWPCARTWQPPPGYTVLYRKP